MGSCKGRQNVCTVMSVDVNLWGWNYSTTKNKKLKIYSDKSSGVREFISSEKFNDSFSEEIILNLFNLSFEFFNFYFPRNVNIYHGKRCHWTFLWIFRFVSVIFLFCMIYFTWDFEIRTDGPTVGWVLYRLLHKLSCL